ncbi:MAG: hypothetical protein AB1529_03805 [Candidatus Micrarchaeota archaeon]
MFVSFDLAAFLAWLFISTFLPGALLSLAIFRKEESFNLLEKVFIGFALGFFLLPMLPFLLYLFLGVKFSSSIALLSVAVLYAVAGAAFVVSKAYEDLKLPKELRPELSPASAVPALLILLLVFVYLSRIGSYSPVFQELDPYFYTYPAYQLLTLGENPINAQTAWYPEVNVSHRIVPALSYLESSWYSLYTGGGDASNMLLAIIASMYPPVAAVLAVFFVYLFVSVATKREWGLLAAALAAFVPVFVYKTAAGEQEVQPYAFFALFFFYSMYVLSLRRRDVVSFGKGGLVIGKDIVFPLMAGIAFSALALGSASQILAVVSLVIFIISLSILYFLRDDDGEELKHLLVSNSIIFVIGPLLASAIIKPMFDSGAPSFSLAIAYALALAFCGVLYAMKSKVPDKSMGAALLGAIMVLGLALYVATPAGDYIRSVGRSGFEIAQYNQPLDRTIAEQGTAATTFDGQMGFIASSFFIPPSLERAGDFISILMFVLLLPFAVLGNLLLGIFVGAVNLFLGTEVEFTEKAVSFLLFWVSLLWLAAAYGLWKFVKKEDDGLFLLLLAIVMPPLVVGLIKAKFTIYAGMMLAAAIGFTFAQADGISGLLKDKGVRMLIFRSLLLLGVLFALLQFFYQGFAPSLVWGSALTLYQNNPAALAPKFQAFCDSSGDASVCAAAADPAGFAGKGTNYQYDYKLCLLSVFSKYEYIQNPGAAPGYESQAAFFRCQRLSDYWIDSMEWVSQSTEPGARITSWWDYGHWINYFGLRNAVIRNEHASSKMIGDVAHGYTDASPAELKQWMEEHGSEYALFDIELISSGDGLGGKYGALNYLSCARDNDTSVESAPGESQCEMDHLWETVFMTANPCTISSLTNKTGYTAYKLYSGASYLTDYPSYCIAPTDPNVVAFCRDGIRAVPAYCVGNATLATGETIYGTYYLNQTYPNGDLKLNKGVIQLPYTYPTTYNFGPATRLTLFYTEDAVWLENGQIKSGFEDRKGKFYDSAIYKAIFLNDLPGFRLVYQTPGGEVKIYKIE